jgi:Putative adhesin
MRGERSMTVHQTPGAVHLRLRLSAGWIRITTQETDETRVHVLPLNDDPASVETASAVREELRHHDDHFEVTVEAPEHNHRFFGFSRQPQLGFEITAPTGTSLEASVASADVSGTGSFGGIEVRSASGDVLFEEVAGFATIKTASGDVRLGGAGRGADVKSASGDVRLGRVEERLRATLVSGDLKVDSVAGSTHASTVSGDIRLGNVGRGDATLRSVSGDMVVEVVPGCSVWLDVSSLSGDTSSELDLGEAPAAQRADLEVRASSVSGDIRVTRGHDRTAAGLQPAPEGS